MKHVLYTIINITQIVFTTTVWNANVIIVLEQWGSICIKPEGWGRESRNWFLFMIQSLYFILLCDSYFCIWIFISNKAENTKDKILTSVLLFHNTLSSFLINFCWSGSWTWLLYEIRRRSWRLHFLFLSTVKICWTH